MGAGSVGNGAVRAVFDYRALVMLAFRCDQACSGKVKVSPCNRCPGQPIEYTRKVGGGCQKVLFFSLPDDISCPSSVLPCFYSFVCFLGNPYCTPD